MHKLYCTMMALFACINFAFGQVGGPDVKLKALLALPVTEKVYLHLDKPYYVPGDTLYFKAYVTMGERHEPSRISGVLHAELIDPDNKISQSIKLHLLNGIGWGDFALPDSLRQGNYRVRAYTQWMRNETDPAFFEQTVPLGVPKSNSTTTISANNIQPEISFFPEGGGLVEGISSNVAFKAIGANGLGVAIKGVVMDNDNKQLTAFADTHLGMGSFYLTPQPGKTYKAVLTYADGGNNTVALPLAAQKGIVLSVNNDSVAKASVSIEVNKAYYDENHDKDYSVVIYAGGKATIFRAKLDNPVISFDIQKRKLGTGVVTVTLFNAQDEPLCERLIFVQNYDRLDLTVSTDQPVYHPKDKVTINLNAVTRAELPATGSFSVSVTDESKVVVDENAEHTILTNLLLTSDLKGYVEQPNYYFNTATDKASQDLDLVMLTHGYRKFEWKQLLNMPSPLSKNQPERGIDIKGVATSLGGAPLKNGQVSLLSPGNKILSETTDNQGLFHFSNLIFTDTAKFILQAVTNKGKKYTKLTYNPGENQPYITPERAVNDTMVSQLMQLYMQNTDKQNKYLSQNGRLQGKMLHEVKIKANAIKKTELNRFYGFPTQLITGEEIGENGQLINKLRELVKSIHFVLRSDFVYIPQWNTSVLFKEPVKILVNDVEMPYGFDFNKFNPDMIEKVEVFKESNILAFTVQYGVNPRYVTSTGILPITVKGFYKAREFYSPKYNHPDDSKAVGDYRSTIYWEPNLTTDANGNAAFDFYNARSAGNYRVVIEGIDDKGNIGRQVYRYQVK